VQTPVAEFEAEAEAEAGTAAAIVASVEQGFEFELA